MEFKTVELELKKIGITLLFCLLAVFHRFFSQWGRFGTYNPTIEDEDREWTEITEGYEEWIQELDYKACIASGKQQEACRTTIYAT
jgi:hypothetical protein